MGFDPSNPNIKLINDVLGNKPVESSVRMFFENPVIQELWWGKSGSS
jgi:hypothetical protein